MDEFGKARRVWRVIYPALIYIAVTFVVAFIAIMVVFMAKFTSLMAPAADGIPDMTGAFASVAEEGVQYLTENALLISLCGYVVSAALFIPMWSKTRKRYPRWNGGKFSVPVALCSAGAAIGINMILSVIITLTGVVEMLPSYDIITDFVTSGSLLLQIVAVGIVGPLAEELCFRGITMNRMSGIRVWIAVGVQAVLFGIMHLNLLQSAYAAIIGVFLGFLMIRYRSIIYAIIAHIAFNLYTVLLGQVESELALTIAGIAILLITAVSIVGLVKCKKAEPYEPPAEFGFAVEYTDTAL